MSSFSGLQVGLSSLYAQRRGLELTGHNIANANTEGYSRQRLRLEGNGGPITPAVHSRWNGAGSGVDVAGVQRMRDGFLESRALLEHGTGAQLSTTRTTLGRVEAILGEPGDAGLQAQLAEFWQGWDDVANHPDEDAARSQLLERSRTLTAGLNQAANRLDSQWAGSSEQLDATLQEINATASNVAELNKSIIAATQAGLSPHDLADQRDVLVQRLGQLAGVTARPGKDGAVDVFVGGTALVRGSDTEALKRAGEVEPVRIQWAKDDYPADITRGELGGLLTSLNEVLPSYRARLDGVAASLVSTVNAVHEGAFTRDGGAGGQFFAVPLDAAGNPAVTARGLTLVVETPDDIAASDVDPATLSPGQLYPVHAGGAAAALAEKANADDGPDAAYRATIVTLGVEAQTAERRVAIQAEISSQVDDARDAQAGVNLDEEMTNMLAYQRAYEGAARFVTSVDAMLDTLINRTGLVGR